MRSIYSFILFALFLFIINACSSAGSENIVAKYGDYTISKEVFKKAYVKSVGSLEEAKDDTLAQLESYLDLYLNYKMKLRNTEVRDYHRDESVISELENYKDQIGKSFIEERYVVAPGVEKLYEDDKFEYKFRHVLIRPDTISRKQAYDLCLNIIDELNNGADFVEMVKKYSGDRATKRTGGEIYFIKASQMPVPNFVDAFVSCPVGEVYAKPILSSAGYHVLQVIEKRPVRYRIKVSHIIRDFKNDKGQPDTSEALATIQHVQELIKQGVPFDSLAMQYSEDPGSKARGGDLGSFPRRSMVLAFDSTVFNLNVGEVSEIIKTRFGFHIAKCSAEEEMPSFKTLEPSLRQVFEKNYKAHRFEEYKDKLKEKYLFKVNKKIGAAVQAGNKDSVTIGDEYLASGFRNKLKDENAYSFKGKDYSFDDLLTHFIEKGDVGTRMIDSNLVKNLLARIGDELVIEAKLNDMEKEDSEFADIIEEYKNGILIFKLQEEEVWSKINVDSLGMREYYETHKDDFYWEPRVSYKAVICSSDSLARMLKSKTISDEEFNKLFDQLSASEDPGIETKVVELVDTQEDTYSKKACAVESIGGISEVFISGKKNWAFVQLTEKLGRTQKTFEEAQNEVAGPYQELLTQVAEAEYIKKMEGIYTPVKYYDRLENIFK